MNAANFVPMLKPALSILPKKLLEKMEVKLSLIQKEMDDENQQLIGNSWATKEEVVENYVISSVRIKVKSETRKL